MEDHSQAAARIRNYPVQSSKETSGLTGKQPVVMKGNAAQEAQDSVPRARSSDQGRLENGTLNQRTVQDVSQASHQQVTPGHGSFNNDYQVPSNAQGDCFPFT